MLGCVALWTNLFSPWTTRLAEARFPVSSCPGDMNPAIPNHFVTLPNGKVLCSGSPAPAVHLNHVTVELATVGVRQDYVPQIEFAVGNHAELFCQEKVATPAGEATLALVKRMSGAYIPNVRRWRWLRRSERLFSDRLTTRDRRCQIWRRPGRWRARSGHASRNQHRTS